MSVVALCGLSFLFGMIVDGIDDWRVWLPFTCCAGLLTGTLGIALGVM